MEDVVRGDRVLVSTGALVPVDGRLLNEAVLDEAALSESRCRWSDPPVMTSAAVSSMREPPSQHGGDRGCR